MTFIKPKLDSPRERHHLNFFEEQQRQQGQLNAPRQQVRLRAIVNEARAAGELHELAQVARQIDFDNISDDEELNDNYIDAPT